MSVPGEQIQGYVTNKPPRSPRASTMRDMVFQPGVVSNSSARSIQGRWKDSNRIRWHKGQAEKIKGWAAQTLTGANGGVYIGTVRGVTDWASLDGQEWIAFGTECKLYLVNNNILYDITPVRRTANLQNPFTTVNGSPDVNVFDPGHTANQGDHISIQGTYNVGGVTINGDYDIITVVDPNNYTIVASSNATSSVTGGGAVSISYDISCGLAENGEVFGYGTGQFGMGTFGTPRPTGSGIPQKMRIWSLQPFGEDLAASFTDGEIYFWQRSNGPNARATIITQAPVDVQRILVNPDLQYLIAIGASDVFSNAVDKMNIRWCSQSDINDWIPVLLPVPNTAGGQRMNFGDRMVTGIVSNNTILLWSDTQLYQMQFIGQPDIFGFQEKGKCYIVGPNAAIDVNGTAYFMGFDDFYLFNGVISIIPCDVWEYVFNDFDRTQAEAVYCTSYFTKNEVTWFYPAQSVDETRYVTFNYDLGCWYYGKMERTAFHDVSPALTGFFEAPYAFNGGILYQHEIGFDEVEPTVTNAMDYFLESWDIGQQSDEPVLINSVIPDFPITQGVLQLFKGMAIVFRPKEYPTQQTDAPFPDVGPIIITPTTTKVDARVNGTQTALRIQAAVVNGARVFGQWFRMGVWQAQATPYGRRIGGSTAGNPIDTSGP